LVVGVVAKPPFPLSPAKTGRDIGDEDRASAMFVDAGDRCRPTIAPPPAVGGAQATLRCGRAACSSSITKSILRLVLRTLLKIIIEKIKLRDNSGPSDRAAMYDFI
jgi:hypothetical protein